MSSSGGVPRATTRRSHQTNADEHRRAQREQPPQPGQAARLGQHQREHQRQHARAEQTDAARGRCAARGPGSVARDQPRGEHQRDDADRHVDEEDPPPAVGLARHREDHAARRSGRPPSRSRPSSRRTRTPARARRRGTAAGSAPSSAAPARPPRSPAPAGPRRARRSSGPPPRPRCTARTPPSATRNIVRRPIASPEPPGRDEREPERQRVAGDHPLHRRRAGAEAPLDRRQRHGDDADVEQAHEPRDERDREGLPPARVGLVAGHGGRRRSERRSQNPCLPGAGASGRVSNPTILRRARGPAATRSRPRRRTAPDRARRGGHHGRRRRRRRARATPSTCTTSASPTRPARSSTRRGSAARRSGSRSARAASSRAGTRASPG